MTTVLDTIPEFEGSAEAARQKLNNFTLEAMIEMFAADLERSDRRFLVVRYEGELIAHSVLSVREAGSQKAWGYFFTRYVLPEHRRRGVGGLLLDAGIEWFQAAGCRYAEAHTHITNEGLLCLFASRGFQVVERIQRPWPHVRLRLELSL